MAKRMLYVLAFSLAAGARPAAAGTSTPFEDFSFEDVEQIVKNQHPKDIPQLLGALPPEFMSSYTLVHDSRSIQGASEANPRAIVFGATAKFILAFNGDPAQPGYQRVEMMQFRDSDNHYELREITFDQQAPVVSDKNPARCLACHGAVPHPIWQTYPEWKGVFGSNDDNSEPAYETFMANAPAHPRYKYLHARPDLSDHWPYRSASINPGVRSEFHVYRPNDRLGRLIGGRGTLSAKALLDSSAFYRTHKHAVLYNLLRCDETKYPPLEWFPSVDKLFEARFPAREFPELYETLVKLKDSHYQTNIEMEKLILDSADLSWNLSLGLDGGRRFSPDGFLFEFPKISVDGGLSDIDDLLGVRVLHELSDEDPNLKQFLKPVTAVENYVAINGAYSVINLKQWNIDTLYDSVNQYMDYPTARNACGPIMIDALKELGSR